jgi:DNA topoisomerase-3
MTNPPKPYTYHSLLAAMNSIHLHVKDQQIRAKLKEIAGIGTEATQESILAVLFKRGYLKKEKKQVISTDLGQALIGILSGGEGEGEIKSSVMVYPDMTALWEQRMTAIESGSLSLDSFLGDVADMVRGIISSPLNIPPKILGFKRLQKCLTEGCEGYLRHIGLKGKSPFFSCPLCHKTFNDVGGSPVPKSEKTGEIITAPCPLGCGGSARRFEGKYGVFWKCGCSPETTFNDTNGAPTVREAKIEAKWPVTGCKGTAMRLLSKKIGVPFWLCHVCGNFFDDLDGVPVPRKAREVGGV